MRNILTTVPLEDCDQKIYRKPDFMFEDVAPDTDHQLLAGEGQWIFNWNARVIHPVQQALFPTILLSVCNEASENEMACDPDHRLSPRGYFDGCLSRLCNDRSSSMHTWFSPQKCPKDVTTGENPVMA